MENPLRISLYVQTPKWDLFINRGVQFTPLACKVTRKLPIFNEKLNADLFYCLLKPSFFKVNTLKKPVQHVTPHNPLTHSSNPPPPPPPPFLNGGGGDFQI